jgi:hypothetical protein
MVYRSGFRLQTQSLGLRASSLGYLTGNRPGQFIIRHDLRLLPWQGVVNTAALKSPFSLLGAFKEKQRCCSRSRFVNASSGPAPCTRRASPHTYRVRPATLVWLVPPLVCCSYALGQYYWRRAIYTVQCPKLGFRAHFPWDVCWLTSDGGGTHTPTIDTSRFFLNFF